MKTLHLGRQAAALAMLLPLLTGCQKTPVDTSLQDNSSIRDEARQQEIQRQMEEAQRAAAAQQMSQRIPQLGFAH